MKINSFSFDPVSSWSAILASYFLWPVCRLLWPLLNMTREVFWVKIKQVMNIIFVITDALLIFLTITSVIYAIFASRSLQDCRISMEKSTWWRIINKDQEEDRAAFCDTLNWLKRFMNLLPRGIQWRYDCLLGNKF